MKNRRIIYYIATPSVFPYWGYGSMLDALDRMATHTNCRGTLEPYDRDTFKQHAGSMLKAVRGGAFDSVNYEMFSTSGHKFTCGFARVT